MRFIFFVAIVCVGVATNTEAAKKFLEEAASQTEAGQAVEELVAVLAGGSEKATEEETIDVLAPEAADDPQTAQEQDGSTDSVNDTTSSVSGLMNSTTQLPDGSTRSLIMLSAATCLAAATLV